jgi:hypothetical protein
MMPFAGVLYEKNKTGFQIRNEIRIHVRWVYCYHGMGGTCGTHGEGEGKCVYRILVRRSEGKRPLGRPRRKWDNNIKRGFREIGTDGVNWIRLAQDRVQWRVFVNTVMNFRVP